MPDTILVVEDHDAVRRSLRDWLEVAFPLCRVLEASSGEEALVLIRDDPPHLVVMDITLPGINGIEATRQIKAILPSAQVVMLTIHESDAYRADAMEAGASGYVPKPMASTDLVPTLTALFAGPGRSDLRDSSAGDAS